MELSNYGSYSSWQTLIAHQPEFSSEFLSINYPQDPNLHFTEMPEILPGWSLRFNVHADGQGYGGNATHFVLLLALTPPMCCSGWVQDLVQQIAEEYIGAAGQPRSKPDVDGTVSFSNFAVKRFALPDDAAFVSVGCIPARSVYQVFQPHINESTLRFERSHQ
jgi:hypothetical protein